MRFAPPTLSSLLLLLAGLALSADPTSVPDAPSGSTNVVVDLASSSVVQKGAWSSIDASACSPSTKALRSTNNVSVPFGTFALTYNFTGSAVYLSLSTSNAVFAVGLDGKDTFYGFDFNDPTPANCTFGYSKTGLSGDDHSLKISVGTLSSARRDYKGGARALEGRANPDLREPWTVEVDSIVVVQSGSGSAGGSTGSGGNSTQDGGALRNVGSASWLAFLGASVAFGVVAL
ncbi:hypothetical protein MKEN_01153700 [Mycena kentingensis (nom. inval.)]|nr:hypothetical protein MKEN_01153700 [Mycena kentingensis (nom. inval.)]